MTIVSLEQLGNNRWVVQEGSLKFFAAPKSVFTIRTYDSEYQICQIVFGKKDGSIYLSTPYFGAGQGLVAATSIPAFPPYTIQLQEGGKVTSHLVKLSHHPDGAAHFSQDGRVRTIVRRRTFPLNRIGRLFFLHVYGPAAFTPLRIADRRSDRAYLSCQFPRTLPRAITVSAEWRRKSDIAASIDRPDATTGPVSSMIYRKTGEELIMVLLGQPGGYPLTDHLLLLRCHETQDLDVTFPSMILLAAFDLHEGQSPSERGDPNGCLAWLYPSANADTLRERIGTIDLDPTE